MNALPHHLPAISVIIAARNEARNLRHLCSELMPILRAEDEVVIVNDHSGDDTINVLAQLSKDDTRIRAVSLRAHAGQTAAIYRGVAIADNEVIATMDGDLQSDPNDLESLLLHYAGDKIVCGWRKNRRDPFFRKTIPSKLANLLVRMMFRLRTHDVGCSMRVFPKASALELFRVRDAHRYLPILFHLRGYRTEEVIVNHRPRFHGRSHYRITRFARVIYDLLRIKASDVLPIMLPQESRISVKSIPVRNT